MTIAAVHILHELANLDAQITSIQKKYSEQKQTLATLDAKIEQARNQIEAIKQEATGRKKELIRHEHDLATYLHQRNLKQRAYEQSKTRQQQEATELELANLESSINQIETHILQLMEENEQAQITDPKAIQEITKTIASLQDDRVVIEQEHAQTGETLQDLQTRFAQKAHELTPDTAAEFERVRKNLAHPIVFVTGGACGGCQMHLTIHMRESIKAKGFVRCDECHRFIVEKQ